MNRRGLLKIVGFSGLQTLCYQNSYSLDQNLDWTMDSPPLFCVAYIDPGIESQRDQEKHVAKYPMALVPQDSRPNHRAWRDRIKNYNPKIKLIAYQMVIEETVVPGPGHDILRKLGKSWVTFPGGHTPTVTFPTATGKNRFRVFDPRTPEWQEGFVRACTSVMESYPYDGLFLDQCTIYKTAAVNPIAWNEMNKSLQSVLLVLRSSYPHKIIIANSRYSWRGLNGEMNESRPEDIEKESLFFDGHVGPRYELFHYYMKSENDTVRARTLMHKAFENKMYFGAGINAQNVRLYPFMQEVLDTYRS